MLRWFDGRTDASGADGADAAAGLADGLLRDQCASLRALLLRAARELHDESALPPAAAVAAAAAAAVQVRKAEARWRAMGEDATGDAPASRDQRQEEGGARASPVASPPRRAAAAGKAGVGGPAASLVMRASYLAAALDRVGAVQVRRPACVACLHLLFRIAGSFRFARHTAVCLCQSIPRQRLRLLLHPRGSTCPSTCKRNWRRTCRLRPP